MFVIRINLICLVLMLPVHSQKGYNLKNVGSLRRLSSNLTVADCNKILRSSSIEHLILHRSYDESIDNRTANKGDGQRRRGAAPKEIHSIIYREYDKQANMTLINEVRMNGLRDVVEFIQMLSPNTIICEESCKPDDYEENQ